MNGLTRYQYDIIQVKRCGDIDKVQYLAKVKTAGLEVPEYYNGDKQTTTNDEKLFNNLVRAKTTVQEYALCNKWDYFCTLTVSPEKFDRYNLKEIYKTFSKWVNNYNRTANLKYLIIPEQHKDNAWHFHGLLAGVPPQHIINNSNGYPTWKPYADRFGFANVSPVRDHLKVSNYITKYITKDLGKGIEKGDHLFYASHGLSKPKIIMKGKYRLLDGVKFDYENKEGTYAVLTYDNRIHSPEEYITGVL